MQAREILRPDFHRTLEKMPRRDARRFVFGRERAAPGRAATTLAHAAVTNIASSRMSASLESVWAGVEPQRRGADEEIASVSYRDAAGGWSRRRDRRRREGTYEVYDPKTNAWSAPRPLPERWYGHTAELGPDGRVLVTVRGRTFTLRVD